MYKFAHARHRLVIFYITICKSMRLFFIFFCLQKKLSLQRTKCKQLPLEVSEAVDSNQILKKFVMRI